MIEQAIVLAGGLGTRLRPLTHELPKALIKLRGKVLAEHIIELLKETGVTKLVLAVGKRAHCEKIIDHFGDGTRLGISISYVIEEEPAGTAGPLALMRPENLEERFYLLNCDNLFALDFQRFESFHRSKAAVATIALTAVLDRTALGSVVLGKDGTIERFVEKGERGPGLISSGWYICERAIRDYLPKALPASLEREVFPKIAGDGRLFGYYDRGVWFDVGAVERLKQAEREWRRR